MGQVIVSGAGRGTAPSTDVPSATEMMWLYEYDGIFVVPKNGTYKIEMHGGGGGMAAQKIAGSTDVIVSTGGGSGEVHQIDLTQGASVHITIGRGGTSRFNPDSETSIIQIIQTNKAYVQKRNIIPGTERADRRTH